MKTIIGKDYDTSFKQLSKGPEDNDDDNNVMMGDGHFIDILTVDDETGEVIEKNGEPV